MGSLITNQNEFLGELINNILPGAENLYFLVGYFYFSGIQKIYKNLKDKNLKILVGMNIEKGLGNKIKEVEIISESNRSRVLIKEEYYKNLVKFFNESDYFDTKEKQEAFKLFIEKIYNGTLEIRKTLKPTHAKMYIFENKPENSEGGHYPGPVIIGSSNLSHAGLEGRIEVNTILRDKTDFEQAKEIFNKLWEESVKIASSDNDEFYTKVIEKIWFEKYPSPYLLYIRVLLEYFTEEFSKEIKFPSEISKNQYLNLAYQIHAIRTGINIINKHDGVLIADVVGLGKSIIASTIAYNLGLKTIIIAPPHLKSQWEDYGWQFNLIFRVYSSGKIEQAYLENSDDEEKLIIIDEAHKYRNELTNDYANLHKLCQGNKVILLTATPFNNRPQDLFSLIKLFQIPAHSTIRTVDNLWYRFKQLIKQYKNIDKMRKEKKTDEAKLKVEIKSYAESIRDLLSPFIIRRSRLDLIEIDEFKKDLEAQKIKFPEVQPPKLLVFDLGEIRDLYFKTLERISPSEDWNIEVGDWKMEKGFIGARYKPVTYLKDIKKYRKKIKEEFGSDELFRTAQVNLAKFMRRLLVRRFESSIKAFEKSLDSMIKSTENILKWYDDVGKVPIYKKGNLPSPENLFDSTGEDLELLNIDEIIELGESEKLNQLIEKGLILIDKKEIKKQFRDDLEKDLNLLLEIKNLWFEKNKILADLDPKFMTFQKVLREKLEENNKRKIVVFTEFADTANYLENKLKGSGFKVLLYTGQTKSKTKKEELLSNFDASYQENEQKNDYDILVATDAISEGVNLNRAGIIFNYDIPYNPTRVIQRVGRINRINKLVFDKLYIYNFFPTAKGEDEISIKRISTMKIALIHALLGEDTKFLTSEEELESYFQKQYKKLAEEQEERSWEIPYYNLLSNIKKNNKLIEEALNIPKRVKIKRTTQKEQNGVLIFGKKGDNYVFKFGNKDKIISLTSFEGISLFEATEEEKAEKPDDNFYGIYEKIKKNLFTSKREIVKDKGLSDTIKKLDVLKEKLPDDKSYFDELKYIVEKLGALPEKYLKQIRDIDNNTLEEDIKKLKEDIPPSYISKIRAKVEKLEDAEESIIISEQLI